MQNLIKVAIAASALVVAAPAFAQSAPANLQPEAASPVAPVSVPEPSDMALFALGVVGLIIGRRSSRSRRRDDE